MENPDIHGVGDAGSPSELAGIYSSAVRMWAAGRMVEAKAACEHLIAVAPRHAEGLQLLGSIHFQCGDFRRAVELLRRSIEVNPNAPAAWLDLGRILHALKLSHQAAAMFRRAIALRPDLARAHLALGEVLTQIGDHAAAATSYRRALVLNPALIEPHNGLGRAVTSLRLYMSHRPDSDVIFAEHPELAELYPKWISHNLVNNSGDVPRLYAWILNIKQVMADGVPGHFAEVGVYRGNSAAVLAHYARRFGRNVYLFDTFEGFDARDLTGIDAKRGKDFAQTSLDLVRSLVGDEAVTYIKGYFPQSVPPQVADSAFSVVSIDCDLYQPIKASLEFFYSRLSEGGMLLLHDYSSGHFAGARQAINEFAVTVPETPVLLPDKAGTAVLRKNRR
jgi:tetratricopeptide (TPR) repeat protein